MTDSNCPIGVVLFGLGPLGLRVADWLLNQSHPYVSVVGAIDLTNVGEDLGKVAGLGRATGIKISDDAATVLQETNPDVVIHMTSSSLEKITPQLQLCADANANVVTSCEELSYPFLKQRRLSEELGAYFKHRDVTLLGTGINPGFLMDKLPLLMTAPALQTDSIKVTRMMYSRVRRPSFQKKIGTGMEKEDFLQLIKDRVITGHVGLIESAAMIVGGMGWKVDNLRELPVEPVMCDKEVTTYTDPSKTKELMTVKPGQVAGLRNVVEATKAGKKVLELDFVAHANVEEGYDLIELKGVPDLKAKILEGMNGDIGTAAILINCCSTVRNARSGLITMKETNPPTPYPWAQPCA